MLAPGLDIDYSLYCRDLDIKFGGNLTIVIFGESAADRAPGS